MSPAIIDKDQKQREKVLPVLYFCATFFVLGLVAALIWAKGWQSAMTSVEWILACSISGGFIGFLFGIPKVVQTTGTAGTAETGNDVYRQQVNTNLSEISDWLTKIIVGLGLVKLTKIPPYLKNIAQAFATGLNDSGTAVPPTAMAFAYGIIIGYFVVGFLFGYLVTRLYLAAEFKEVDKLSTLTELKNQIDTAQAKLENVEAGQSMLTQSLIQNAPTAAAAGDQNIKLAELRKQADAYLDIKSNDYGTRVRMKDASAGNMAAFAFSNNISKADILALNDTDFNQGLIVAMATMIISKPEPGDLDKLLAYADKVTWKHVEYRVLNAISQLMTQKLVKEADKDRINKLIDVYRKNADGSILERIKTLAAQVKDYSEK